MTDTQRTYLPAAGKDWALPLFDPLLKLFGADSARKVLLDQAVLTPGLRVLDIGCGTGTLAVLIKRLNPSVSVVGLDPDPKALAIARKKADREHLAVQFDRGFSDQLPYAPASIVCSPRSCITISRTMKRRTPFARCIVCFAQAALFT